MVRAVRSGGEGAVMRWVSAGGVGCGLIVVRMQLSVWSLWHERRGYGRLKSMRRSRSRRRACYAALIRCRNELLAGIAV